MRPGLLTVTSGFISRDSAWITSTSWSSCPKCRSYFEYSRPDRRCGDEMPTISALGMVAVPGSTALYVSKSGAAESSDL